MPPDSVDFNALSNNFIYNIKKRYLATRRSMKGVKRLFWSVFGIHRYGWPSASIGRLTARRALLNLGAGEI